MHSFRSIVNIGRHVHDLSKAITYINVHDANVRSTIIQLSKRVYSSNANNEPNTEKGPPTPTATKLPALMKVPYSHLLSGLPLYGPLSWIAKVFIIRQIEPEFDMYDFKYGAAQALYVTSKYLSQRKYNEVQELFLPQTLKALKRNLDKMTDEQRQEIHITQGDTIDVFPYQAGITNGINDEQYLEITVIFRVQKPKEPNGIRIFGIDRNTKFCYCSFVSEVVDVANDEYEENDDDNADLDWTIRRLNCIKISDLFKTFSML